MPGDPVTHARVQAARRRVIHATYADRPYVDLVVRALELLVSAPTVAFI